MVTEQHEHPTLADGAWLTVGSHSDETAAGFRWPVQSASYTHSALPLSPVASGTQPTCTEASWTWSSLLVLFLLGGLESRRSKYAHGEGKRNQAPQGEVGSQVL